MKRHDTLVDMIAKRVLFFGRVQGVGFRYQVVERVHDLPIRGFVRNLSDGSVELFLQGTSNDVDEGIRRIQEYWKFNIERSEVTDEKPRADCGPMEIT